MPLENSKGYRNGLTRREKSQEMCMTATVVADVIHQQEAKIQALEEEIAYLRAASVIRGNGASDESINVQNGHHKPRLNGRTRSGGLGSLKTLTNGSVEKGITTCCQAFRQHFVLSSSVEVKTEDSTKDQVMQVGSRHMDPFLFKKVDVMDVFPSEEEVSEQSSPFKPDELSPFCFPNGVRAMIVPRVILPKAKQRLWPGQIEDKYQVLVFTDGSGDISYGVAITVVEEIDDPDCVTFFSSRRLRRRSSIIIARCWRKYNIRRRQSSSRRWAGRRHSMTVIPNNSWNESLQQQEAPPVRQPRRSSAIASSFNSMDDEASQHSSRSKRRGSISTPWSGNGDQPSSLKSLQASISKPFSGDPREGLVRKASFKMPKSSFQARQEERRARRRGSNEATPNPTSQPSGNSCDGVASDRGSQTSESAGEAVRPTRRMSIGGSIFPPKKAAEIQKPATRPRRRTSLTAGLLNLGNDTSATEETLADNLSQRSIQSQFTVTDSQDYSPTTDRSGDSLHRFGETNDVSSLTGNQSVDEEREHHPAQRRSSLSKSFNNIRRRLSSSAAALEVLGNDALGSEAPCLTPQRSGVGDILDRFLTTSPIPQVDTENGIGVWKCAKLKFRTSSREYTVVVQHGPLKQPATADVAAYDYSMYFAEERNRLIGMLKDVVLIAPKQLDSSELFHVSVVCFQEIEPGSLKPRKIIQVPCRGSQLDCKHLASESYKKMLEADSMGEVVLMEKCYVLMGCSPKEQSMLFVALQQYIDFQRKMHATDGIQRLNDSMPDGDVPKLRLGKMLQRPRESPEKRRKDILSEMRHNATLSSMADSMLPKGEFDHLRGKVEYFKLKLPHLETPALELPLPLPQVADEWGLATLILRIGVEPLMKILKLLLMERSALVLGFSTEEVTACVCALVELIRPFKWAGAFLPLLPTSMLDVVDCPVPFVVGVAVEGKNDAKLRLTEYDPRIQKAAKEGMTVVNLAFEYATIKDEDDKELGIPLRLRDTLDSLKANFAKKVKEPEAKYGTLQSFVQGGLSRQESLTLHSMKKAIYRYVLSLAGDLTTEREAWKRYGHFDERSGSFEFVPSLYYEPLVAEVAFKKRMAQTQHFSAFVHTTRNEDAKLHELHKSNMGEFVAAWMYEKWRENKNST